MHVSIKYCISDCGKWTMWPLSQKMLDITALKELYCIQRIPSWPFFFLHHTIHLNKHPEKKLKYTNHRMVQRKKESPCALNINYICIKNKFPSIIMQALTSNFHSSKWPLWNVNIVDQEFSEMPVFLLVHLIFKQGNKYTVIQLKIKN